jgi:hypothetical protein
MAMSFCEPLLLLLLLVVVAVESEVLLLLSPAWEQKRLLKCGGQLKCCSCG